MDIFFFLIILFFSIIVHEYAHAQIAYSLGDPTAKYAGRLTLNPIPHIDIIGTIFIPMILVFFHSPILFGWAKPVPINPYNFSDQKYGQFKVATAGPASNLLIAFIFGSIIRFFPDSEILLPLFPLFGFIVLINILLALFNSLPIPPLDGSHILFTFLPNSMNNVKMFLSQYGFFLLLGFIIFGGFRLLSPIILMIFYLFTGGQMPI